MILKEELDVKPCEMDNCHNTEIVPFLVISNSIQEAYKNLSGP